MAIVVVQRRGNVVVCVAVLDAPVVTVEDRLILDIAPVSAVDVQVEVALPTLKPPRSIDS